MNAKNLSIKNDLLSGLTVALVLVPEAIAFSFVCHVSPLVGLYAAFIVGLITAVFGGRPGMISGATGAVAVVLAGLVIQQGAEYLFAAVLLMGALQVCAGLLRLGKFVRLIPYPVMLGFVNGLAIIIFLAQIDQFRSGGKGSAWLVGADLYWMLGMVFLTMLICWLWPKMTGAVPASLTAILAVTLLSAGLSHWGILESRTILDYVKILAPGTTSLAGGGQRFIFRRCR